MKSSTQSILRVCAFLAVINVLAVVAGCGTGNSVSTAPTSGTVTLGGKPLEGAIVSFFPEGGGVESVAVTNGAGDYKMMTIDQAGTAPGSYKVTISHLVPKDGTSVPEGMDPIQLKMQGLAVENLPERYSDYEKTELKADVTSESNDIDFDLSTS